jgi:uncharacterized protein (DUF885 family)
MTEDTTQTAQTDAVQPDNDGDRTAGQDDAPVGLTQAQLNDLLSNTKKKVRLKTQQEFGDYDALKAKAAKLDEIEAAQLSENEKLQKQIADMQRQVETKEQEVRQAALNTLRLKVGTELGLPTVLSELLRGEDADAMKEHAETLLGAINASAERTGPPNIDATKGGEQRAGKSRADLPPAVKKLIAQGMITEEGYLAAQETLEG